MQHTPQSPQWASVTLRSVISILIFQTCFYGIIILMIYWVLTLNWVMLTICAIISCLQMLVKKEDERYIRFVLNIMRPQEYFQMTRHYSQEIPNDEKTIFGFHPHSIFGYGILVNLNRRDYSNQKLTYAIPLGSRFVLGLPFVGLHFRLWGFQSVDPNNFRSLLEQGKDVALIPGGYEQATLTSPKQLRIFLKNRKGFVKYALKYGYTMRPVLITNEHKAMWTYDGMRKVRLFFNKLKIPGAVYWGKYGLFFPPGLVIHTLIGRGVKGDKIYGPQQSPTKAQIKQLHKKYIEEVERLYNDHKDKNGNTPLKIY